MAELHDFGEKIGGARKDLWRSRGLTLSDLDEMTVTERSTHITKENIWQKPDWQQQIADGKPQALAYWQNKMRQAIPPRPPKDDEYSQNNYVQVVGAIRDAVMAVDSPYKIDTFYQTFLRPAYITSDSGYYVHVDPAADGVINNKVLRAAQSRQSKMQAEAEKKLFGIPKNQQTYVKTKSRLSVHKYDGIDVTIEPDPRDDRYNILAIGTMYGRSFYYLKEGSEFHDIAQWGQGKYFIMDNVTRRPIKINFESAKAAADYIEEHAKQAQNEADTVSGGKGQKKNNKRKSSFVPPQLSHIKRTGPNYRHLRHADGTLFMDELKFRAGEYGNWLNQNDRQASLDMAYDALRDLARLLQIRPEDVSLDGSLAIAFGARGIGGSGAAAHYERGRQVINLTKMSGAGCLAHEWAHALDHAIGLSAGAAGFASEAKSSNIPKPFTDLLDALKYKKITISPEDLSAELAPQIEHTKKQLRNWIDSVKPHQLPDDLLKKWDAAADNLVQSASAFNGIEYMSLGRNEKVVTKPEIEILSQIRKLASNSSIPRDTKRQIAMWAFDLKKKEEAVKSSQPQERTVKTDFFNGSVQFDAGYSRAGHGYYQSTCEMFARAFDCYIADKITADGNKSDYLSAYANCFAIPKEDGHPIAAIPLGEEREAINAKFDLLLDDLKSRGFLHEYTEEPEKAVPTPEPRPTASFRPKSFKQEPDLSQSEQLSFDDLLFAANERADRPASSSLNHTKDFSR